MNCCRLLNFGFNLGLAALIPAAAISLGVAGAQAQAPASPPTPAAPAPAAPAPATPATPAAPPAASAPAASPPAVAPVQTADPFGEEIALTPRSVVMVKGTANWDSAFETLIDSLKALSALLDK